MNFLFAWRYFKAKKTTNAINIIAWVSVTAITLITAAFIVTLSVFNGFEGLVKSLYSSFFPDIRVSAVSGKVIKLQPSQLQQLRSIDGIRSFSTVVEEKALIQNGDLKTIVTLKGADEQYKDVTGVIRNIREGRYDLGTADRPGIVLGSGVQHAVAADVERSIYPLTVYLFRRGVSGAVLDPYQSSAIDEIIGTGTFFIQQDIDSKYAITNIGFMKRMLSMQPDEFSSVEIAVKDAGKTEEVKKQVQQILGKQYQVLNRYEQDRSLYAVMTLEKWAIFGILTLMLAVAAFTIVGALTMLVLEKQKDIQVLKAVGANNRLVQKIFLSEGLLIGGIGVLTGFFLGLLLCWAQLNFHLVKIEGGTFLINYFPVRVHFADLLLIAATVLLVTLLASWMPSRRAAGQVVELRS